MTCYRNKVLTSDMKAGKLSSAFMIFSNMVSLLRLLSDSDGDDDYDDDERSYERMASIDTISVTDKVTI